MNTKVLTWKRMTCLSVVLSLFFTLQLKAQDPLPDGWTSTDIGTVKLPSKVIYTAEEGMFYVRASGHEYWGSPGDHGHFLYFETEEDKEIVLRVRDFTSATRNGKILINMRAGLDFNDPNMVVELKINRDYNPYVYSCVFYARLTKGAGSWGDMSANIPQNEKPMPRWLKLVRQGSYVSAYHAEDAEDPSQLVWKQLGSPGKLAFKGTAYMGFAVCGGGDGNDYSEAWVDNLEVRDVENPYFVKQTIAAQTMDAGATRDINVTKVFGHYLGDYWTIEPISSNPEVAAVSFYEVDYPNEDNRIEGERYQKFVKINALKDGITAIKLRTNLKGFRMETEFLVDVKGVAEPEQFIPMEAPDPWKLTQLFNSTFRGPHVLSSSTPYILEGRFFNMGGNDIAYYKSSSPNSGDIPNYDAIGRFPYEAVRINSSGVVNTIAANDWLTYTINVKDAGKYKLVVDMATGGTDRRFHVKIDGVNVTGTIGPNDNSGWAFFDYEAGDLFLTAGDHEFRFYAETNNFDLRKFSFTYLEPFEGDVTSYDYALLEYNGSIHNELKIVTEKRGETLSDGSAYLYRQVDMNDDLEMKVYIESVKNTGRGSFSGFMLRETITAGAPFVSFAMGAYEGLRLSYRWEYNTPVITRTLTEITSPCWLMFRKYNDPIIGTQYVDVFYSYDNLYWQKLLNYPLIVDYFTNMFAGIAVSGGNYASVDRKESSVLKNFTLIFNKFEDIKIIDNIDVLKAPLTMNPNNLSLGASATISYKVLKPGRVTLTIYDSFGRLVSILFSENKEPGEYTYTYTANLINTGVYLLRYQAEGDYQFLKFVINN